MTSVYGAFVEMGYSADEFTERLKQLQLAMTQMALNTHLIKTVNDTQGKPISKPKSSNCLNCGAPVDIHAEKCAYCDTPYI